MGMPARRIDTQHTARVPRLVVVKTPARRKAPGRAAQAEASCASAFRAWAFVLVALTVFGVGRVALSAQAAEASLEVGRLRKEIKTERFKGAELEVQQSALMSPSRIQAIAGATMGMATAGQVCYITLDDEAPVAPTGTAVAEAAPSAGRRADGALGAALETVMDLAAGEARVLLVGDVGLASTP